MRSIFLTATAATGYLVGRWRAARNRTVIWVAGALPRRGWAGWSTADRIASVTVLWDFGRGRHAFDVIIGWRAGED